MARAVRYARWILPIWLACALTGCRSAAAKGPPEELLTEGKRRYEAQQFAEAARQFNGVKRHHPESDEAEEAYFMLAESLRHRRKGQPAFKAYQDFAERFPRSRFSLGAAVGEYRLAMDYFEGRVGGWFIFAADRGFGVDVLEHMQIHYRNHSLADDALMRAAAYTLQEARYEESTDLLRRLLAEYPRSEHVLWARYEMARSLWMRNQGAPYDERLLHQSRRAFEDFIGTTRLLGREEEHADRIAEAETMIRRIDERLAEKDYRIGRFYERTGSPKSAVYYYEHCIATFPGTPYAEESRKRLDRIQQRSAG